MSLESGFIHEVPASMRLQADSTESVLTLAPAVWTLAHRGYSGAGRLDVWAYPSQAAALAAGAHLALECGMNEDPESCRLFSAGCHAEVIARYEQAAAERGRVHLLRVQPAFLQPTALRENAPVPSTDGPIELEMVRRPASP